MAQDNHDPIGAWVIRDWTRRTDIMTKQIVVGVDGMGLLL
jgi:hypothetical protein